MQGSDTDNNKAIRDASEEPKVSQSVEVEVGLEPEPPSSNSRIAKNALMFYIRMFLTLIVGLYTSRVVLNTLGVEDYGIYGVVGGVVAMLGFLNASMSGATSRFLTFELGRGDKKRLAETFSSALIVHIIIALIVFVLAETVGLWFVTHKLVIPAGRMTAAHWVYQMSILSAMLGITQVPYNATIIAHERMDVYAYLEIVYVTLKLLIVYLITIGDFDKLIVYAILMFAVSAFMLTIYRIYCVRHFSESRFHWSWNKSILKPLMSFSGWNLYGNFGPLFQQQGSNFVINFFYGVVLNAAVSIGMTVASVVNQFSVNVMTAFRPQIIKYYSVGQKEEMKDLTVFAIKVILFIYSLVAIPVFIEADALLKVWLVNVPEYSALFCRLLLISIFFETIRCILIIVIHATGNVKWVSLTSGTLLLLTPFITYLFLYFGSKVDVAFIILIVVNALMCLFNIYLVKFYAKLRASSFIYVVAQVVAASALALLLATYLPKFNIPQGLSTVINILVAIVFVFLTYGTICFNKSQRQQAIGFLRSKLNLIFKL